MTTEFQDHHQNQKQAWIADEPAGKGSPESEEHEQNPEVNAEDGRISGVSTHESDASEAETNGNGAAETNGDAEIWHEDTAEAGNYAAEDGEAAAVAEAESAEAPESVAEKLKNRLRRKTPGPEIKKLKADLEKLASDNEALRDKYLRLAAEFDNYRKRIDRDFNQRVQSASAELMLDLLPVLDDLERSLNAKAEQQNQELLLNGVKLIQQKFAKVLADRGIEPMQPVGAEFDPNLHDALTEMAVEGKPAGLVLEEHTKGYMNRDRVLRPARVIVSK